MTLDRGLHPLELAIATAWPVADWRDTHVLLAVSGGADSVALSRAVSSLKMQAGGRGKLFVGHLNHGLRGADGDADQAWLAELCDRMGMELEVGTADVARKAAEQGDGTEAAARAARYDFLRQTAERVGARWVATAHTRDDQVETVAHRLIRGTGLAGLAGMRLARPLSPTVSLVRPMLAVRREVVIEYLDSLGQDFRTDASNADLRYTRNRLRHRVLPVLRAEFDSDFDEAIVRLAEQAAEAQGVIDGCAAELVAKCAQVDWSGNLEAGGTGDVARGVRIDCRLLAGESALIVREVCRTAWREAKWPLQAMGYEQWQQLALLAMGDESLPQINLPGNVWAGREGEALLMRRCVAKTQAVSNRD